MVKHCNVNTSLIARNTLLLYVRMFVSMIISLYTSRVVLNILGVEDFGIYNVVGGVVALFSFINGSMSGATSRFITYNLGKGISNSLKATFNSAVIVHLIIATIVLLLAESVGLWFIDNKLVIPQTRMIAAKYVYQFSILSALFSIVQVPYNACVIAHEKMNVYAYIEIFNSIFKLGAVIFLQVFKLDKLILYALMLTIVNLLILLIYKSYCYKSFKESHFEFSWHPKIIKSMLSFSGADLYGNASVVLRQQGVNMLLNIFFGPIVNAANGIATTVSSVTMNLVNNVSTAFRPQIIKKYASDEYDDMFYLMRISAMICLMLFLTVSMPLIFEMKFVLYIWLGQVPQYSIDFCRILLIFSSCTIVTSILNTGIHATGRIYMISFISGTLIWMAVPLIYILLSHGCDANIAYICNGVVSVLVLIINSLIFKYNVSQFSLRMFWVGGILRCLIVCVPTAIVLYLIYVNISESWFRLLVLCSISLILNSLMIFVFIMDNAMRVKIMRKFGFSQKYIDLISSFFKRVEGRIDWEKTKCHFNRIRKQRNQIKIMDSKATIEHIIDTRCSVSRYGDGEFDMIIHMLTEGEVPSISGFQSYDYNLALRLKKIIEEKNYNNNAHIVCVPYWYRSNNVSVYKPGVQRFCKRYLCEKLPYMLSVINLDRLYYNANISRFYLSFKDKSNCQSHIASMKKIWKDRNVCFVEGEYSRLGVGNDLFSGVINIKRILCPAVDAFSKYDLILNTIVQNIDHSTLVIMALGHTATVLAYDLSQLGYQAIDLGHIDVEYEWMLQQAEEKIPLKYKYVNEVSGGAVSTSCDDIEYTKQIVARIM